MMRGAMKIIGGLLLIIGGIWTYLVWETGLANLKRLFFLVIGNVGLYVILIGIVLLIIGFTDLSE